MQNLIKYPKGRYKVTRNIFELCSKYHTGDDPIYNLKCAILRHSREMKNSSRPILYHEFKYMCNEFRTMSRTIMRSLYGMTITSSKHRWNGIRNFSRDSKDDPNDRNNPSSQKPSGNPPQRPPFFHIISLFLIIYFYSLLRKTTDKSITGEDEYRFFQGRWISWSEFVHQILMKGEVKDIVIYKETAVITVHEGAVIKGRMGPINKYFLPVPDWQTMEEKVRKIEHDIGITPGNGVPIIYDRNDETATTFLMLFVCAVLAIMFSVLRKKQLSIKPWEFISSMGKAKFTLVDSLSRGGKGVRFEDVAGLKEAKMEIMEFVDYLKQPERYKTLGAKVPKGALLLGPPGCGKTLLAKAVATEADVPFMSMNGSEFIEVFGGLGAARVRDLFKEGKKRAPSIIYIDEIDAIGKKRSEGGAEWSNGESDRTLNQLLVEMDGMVSKENVIILASTNRAEVLDKALLRPGRFDRHILIDFPTLEERKQIFESHLKKVSLKSEPSKYSGNLAHLTPGFSGADIANVCNEAALHAARDRKRYVDGSDLMYAIDRTIGGVAKKNSTMTPNEKEVVAYHEAGHTIVGWLLKHTDALLKVSIVPRTNLRLGFSQYTQKNQFLRSKEELFDQMCVMLGGRAAENMTFNKISTSAENDLKKVTQLAYQQVQQYGMSPTVGLISFDEEVTSTKNKKIYSKKLASVMDIEARRIITEAYRASETLLKDNAEKLKLVADELLKRETLTYDCIEKLIGPPPHGKKRLVEHGVFDEIIADAPQPSTT